MSSLTEEIERRRTFAIISHPDVSLNVGYSAIYSVGYVDMKHQ